MLLWSLLILRLYDSVCAQWITGAMQADYMTCAVRSGGPGPGGLSLMIVPLDSKGVTRRKLVNTGVAASGSAYIVLEDVL